MFDLGQGPAYAPWENWRGDGLDGPLALVPAAMLAANAHNTQPWRFRIDGARIDLFADRTRGIGAVDPDAREMEISLGCALENLHLAARAHGYDDRPALAPDGPNGARVAAVELVPGAADGSPLYAAIPHRHTNRYDFDVARPLPSTTLDALDALVDDPATRVVLTLNAMGLSAFDLVAAEMFPTLAQSGSGGFADMERRWTATAGAYGIVAIRDGRDLGQRLQAGRLWQRMHLWLTQAGLAAQPMNQLHERADRERQLGLAPTFGDAVRDLVGDPSWQGVFTFRLGWPTRPAPASPRRAVAAVVEADAE